MTDDTSSRCLHAKKRVEDAYGKDRPGYKGCATYNDFREVIAQRDQRRTHRHAGELAHHHQY